MRRRLTRRGGAPSTSFSGDPYSFAGDQHGNRVVNAPALRRSAITFTGQNNLLYCENPGIVLENSRLEFHGNESVVFLSSSARPYRVRLATYHDSTVYIGPDNYFNAPLGMLAAERCNIIIGGAGLFGAGVRIRTSDAHRAYGVGDRKRLNPSASVYIGDHVWVGLEVLLLKGTTVGSGSIIGARGLASGQRLVSNASYGGNPLRLLRNGVFFSLGSVNQFSASASDDSKTDMTSEWIYEDDSDGRLDRHLTEANLAPSTAPERRLEFIRSVLVEGSVKNRFFVGSHETGPGHTEDA